MSIVFLLRRSVAYSTNFCYQLSYFTQIDEQLCLIYGNVFWINDSHHESIDFLEFIRNPFVVDTYALCLISLKWLSKVLPPEGTYNTKGDSRDR